jgi:gamma-carbonic anhydrase
VAKLEPYLDHTPRVADTAFVHEDATLIGDVEVGEESSIWPASVLRADDGPIRIGRLTSIQDGSVIHMTRQLSHTTVGDRVTVGHKVILHGCVVEDDCLIGMGAIILDNARIGRGSLIGAGSLVLQNMEVPPGSLVLGSPARVVRPTNEKEKGMIDFGWREYQARTAEYRARDGA